MILEEIILHIEALVFASEKPLQTMDITTILSEAYPEAEINLDKVQGALEAIKDKYNTEFHSFRMVEVGGGFQFLTKSEYHTTVAKLNGDKFMKRLSVAALETLAIIAYRQPITKPEMEYIRGVSCDYSVQKLLEKELIVISGRNEEAVGKPLLYSTSRSFMDYLGINNMDDLPRLREIVGEDVVIPTNAGDAVPENTTLIVNETGELQEVVKEEAAAETNKANAEVIEEITNLDENNSSAESKEGTESAEKPENKEQNGSEEAPTEETQE